MTTNADNFTDPVSVSTGGTGRSSNTAYTIIASGTTSTGAFQNISGAGTTGQILTSNGAGTLPTWQTNSAGQVFTTSLQLTSAQVKALHATPITLISAQGAGTYIQIINALAKLDYGGTNAFTSSASQTISLYYNTGSGTALTSPLLNAADINNTTDTYGYSYEAYGDNKTAASVENVPIIIYNTSVTEITGNAANNNTITVYAVYVVLTI